MLDISFLVLAGAVLLGSLLAVFYLRTTVAAAAPWPLALLHGALGTSGLGLLALALRGTPRGLEQGTGSFGMISFGLLALAAIAGVGLLVAHLQRWRPGLLLGLHATLAVGGFVILAAYAFTG
jgi:hypothetical protein